MWKGGFRREKNKSAVSWDDLGVRRGWSPIEEGKKSLESNSRKAGVGVGNRAKLR